MIVFENRSELPLECITTFGVSVKENEHPIGQFGTGLKYAIATLLRADQEVIIYIKGTAHRLRIEPGIIREKEFKLIFMDIPSENKSIQLPFTVELGKNWELWQAYRELWSNCRDENGTVMADETLDTFTWEDQCEGTHIIVIGEEFEKVHSERGEFLLTSEPLYKLDSIEIHKSEHPAVFYKGIKVLEIDSKYSYNILDDNLSLTEDRTAHHYEVEGIISRNITSSTNPEAVMTFLTTGGDYFEGKLHFNKYLTPSEEFMKLVSKLRTKPSSVHSYYDHHYPNFISAVGRTSLSKSVKNKISSLYNLLKIKPKDILLSNLQSEDYRVVKESIVLSESLLKNPQRMKFAYLIAVLSMQEKNKGKSAYQLVVENLLNHFNFETIKEKQ